MVHTSTGASSDETNSVDSDSHGNEVVRHAKNLYREAKDAAINFPATAKYLVSQIYIPYFPPLFGPFPWLRIYLMPPYDKKKLDMLIADFSAGLTIGLTLIPQGLSYGSLAGVPPINGLYASIFPPLLYAFTGTSNCLAVGPVAIVSLLTAAAMAKYSITNGTAAAVDFASELCLAMGLILCVMSMLNLGSFIRFLSHPVISGFTSAAAMLIGLSQLKSAFNFSGVPQVGDEHLGVEFQYEQMQWYIKNWNGQYNVKFKGKSVPINQVNPYAAKLCFGVYIPLLIISTLKANITVKPEIKKKVWYQIFNFVTALLPLMAIIITAHVTYNLQTSPDADAYATSLKVVGNLTPGLGIIRKPNLNYPFGKLIGDAFPITLIGFMESYSVARKIATNRDELHILNANQELFAVGAANLAGVFSSAYPVSGSYSRSSLAATAGAKSPFASVVTLIVILIALSSLTSTFYYIPNASLAGIIFVAVTNIISPGELVEAWIHNKNDFFTMLATFVITLAFETSLGLAVGIGMQVLMLLKDIVFSPDSKPFYEIVNNAKSTDPGDALDVESGLRESIDDDPDKEMAVQIVRLNNDLVFLTAPQIKDTLVDEIINKRGSKFKALIVDFTDVKIVDLSGMIALKETATHTRSKKLKFIMVHVRNSIYKKFKKFGIVSDELLTRRIDMKSTGDLYSCVTRKPPSNYYSGLVQDDLDDEKSSLLRTIGPITIDQPYSSAGHCDAYVIGHAGHLHDDVRDAIPPPAEMIEMTPVGVNKLNADGEPDGLRSRSRDAY